MIRYYCDKCGKYFSDDINLNSIIKDGGTMTTEDLGNICGDCLEKLKKWIKGK